MESTDHVGIKVKLEECFENILRSLEEKWPNDYDVLRGISNEYTEMYHELYEHIIPGINSPHVGNESESKESTPTNAKLKKDNEMLHSMTQLPSKNDNRSKTPIKMPITKGKDEVKPKENEKNVIKINKTTTQSPNKKDTSTANTSPRGKDTKERPKTPILGGDKKDAHANAKSTRDLKKDTENSGGNKSSNNLPTVRDQAVKKANQAAIKKTEDTKTKKVETTHPKNIKRDMTPTPMSKKNNALDTSADDIKSHKNKIVKKESKDDPKGKRVSAINIQAKTALDAVNTKGKRNTAIEKKINIDNIKIEAKEEENHEDEKDNSVIEHKDEHKIDLAEIIRNTIQTRIKQKIEFTSKTVECLFIASKSE